MVFQPNAGDELIVEGITYRLGGHPAFKEMPYGQEGRQGTVFQLLPIEPDNEVKALKVFKPLFRNPGLVYQSEFLEPVGSMEGLTVCHRYVITPQKEQALLKKHPDMLYAVTMPWIEGPTWLDIVLDKRTLSRSESLMLAVSFAKLLSTMEQRGMAHCDLSAPNVIIPYLAEAGIDRKAAPIELVDVEQMYGMKMEKPDHLPGGSPGYAAHHVMQKGLWSKYSDRFSGSVILAEMLIWCDHEIRSTAWGESYFDPAETQHSCERHELMNRKLREHWGEEVSRLFNQAWESEELHGCPTFGEWYSFLLNLDEEENSASLSAEEPAEREAYVTTSLEQEEAPDFAFEQEIAKQIEQGRFMESEGNLEGALDIYLSIVDAIPNSHEYHVELSAEINDLKQRLTAAEFQEMLIPTTTPVDVNAEIDTLHLPSPEPEKSAVKGISKAKIAAIMLLSIVIVSGTAYSMLNKKGDSAVRADAKHMEAPLQTPVAKPVPTPIAANEKLEDRSSSSSAPSAEVTASDKSQANAVEPSDTKKSEESNVGTASTAAGTSKVKTMPSPFSNQDSSIWSGESKSSSNVVELSQPQTQQAPEPAPAQTTLQPKAEEEQSKVQQPAPSKRELSLLNNKSVPMNGKTSEMEMDADSIVISLSKDATYVLSFAIPEDHTYTDFKSLAELVGEDDNGSVIITVILDSKKFQPEVLNQDNNEAHIVTNTGTAISILKIQIVNKGNKASKLVLKYPKVL
ncbi:serine/threonine-protein kinase [Paenibacillus alginolyticus]|uniref:Protein kinase domain-containing protein n=1 Tax=Paenibacillus alginolyticus TaxID=59839 RepID=A0ABT4G790_9BACL|nr:hypothetical protein [Paenibacillus alginolyticus]MCY9692046.1 hypothetical protein [Paenibacillus alginolyticus]MEC0144236.1 hypothetical protein [Paenibacillus alginolyticus]